MVFWYSVVTRPTLRRELVDSAWQSGEGMLLFASMSAPGYPSMLLYKVRRTTDVTLKAWCLFVGDKSIEHSSLAQRTIYVIITTALSIIACGIVALFLNISEDLLVSFKLLSLLWWWEGVNSCKRGANRDDAFTLSNWFSTHWIPLILTTNNSPSQDYPCPDDQTTR